CIAQPVERAGLARLGCETAVFQHTERGKEIDLLIASAHAQARAPFWSEMCHLYATEQNAAGTGRQITGEHIDQGRFACAVGTDDRVQLSDLDLERYVVDCRQAAEILGQSAHFEDRFNHSRSTLAEFERLRRDNRLWRSNKPATPSGRTSTTSTIKLPIPNCQCLAEVPSKAGPERNSCKRT